MFTSGTPESVGIKSESIYEFLKFLNGNGLTMNSVILLRGDTIFGEYYWKPFNEMFCHRMYSETKSFVGVAIGLLEEEGKLSLDDRIADHFPEKADGEIHPFMQAQTIRDMLTMTTCVRAPYWFDTADPDRTHEYLNCKNIVRPSGTVWEYDSQGSQVLSSLVEKLSEMTLFDYLNKKIFKYLGTFQTATILKTPNGDSWGDSGLLCTTRDMLSFAKFVMNYGTWEGKRLMNESYLRTATSKLVGNNRSGFGTYAEQGYGYQIWRHDMNGFSFNGMGTQFTICVPEKDFIFVCTANNQGYEAAKHLIFKAVKEQIISKLGEGMQEDSTAYSKLDAYGKTLTLAACEGSKISDYSKQIDEKTYICDPNQQGIKWFSFAFNEKTLVWNYENEQGKKTLRFGLCENHFCKFPQYGYSNDFGGMKTTNGFLYNAACSAGWIGEKTLGLRVQIIDRYFGNLYAVFYFKEDLCAVKMSKAAEDFFNEYEGEFTARAESV